MTTGQPLSIGYLAGCATRFVYESLQRNDPAIRGQKAFEMLDKRQKVNDDRILDCCLYFSQFTRVVLISNDRNLCVKAMIHNIFCFTWDDLPKDRSLMDLLFKKPKPQFVMEAFDDRPAPLASPLEGRKIKTPKTPKTPQTPKTLHPALKNEPKAITPTLPSPSPSPSAEKNKKRERRDQAEEAAAVTPGREDQSRKKLKTQSGTASPRKQKETASSNSMDSTNEPALSAAQLITAVAAFQKSWGDISEVRSCCCFVVDEQNIALFFYSPAPAAYFPLTGSVTENFGSGVDKGYTGGVCGFLAGYTDQKAALVFDRHLLRAKKALEDSVRQPVSSAN